MGKRGPKTKKEEVRPGTSEVPVPDLPVVEPKVVEESKTQDITPESTPDISRHEEPAAAEVLTCGSWLYHNDEQPKIFKAGSEIPAGWHKNQKELDFFWQTDDWGKWTRKAKA